MKKLTWLLTGLGLLALKNCFAADDPRGTLLELHSCELYAGGCVVSSESTLGGRYLLRAWDFAGGTSERVDLAGLQVAVLQAGTENLATDKTKTDQAVVYLPSSASPAQTRALMAWVKSALPGVPSEKLQTRTVQLKFMRNGANYEFSAGDFVSLKTAPLGSCVFGSCGEELWYTPRSATTAFTVAIDTSSRVSEPSLKLKWTDGGKRSVFLGRFGESQLGKSVYVTAADFCGLAPLF
jgi:hypothetical protein